MNLFGKVFANLFGDKPVTEVELEIDPQKELERAWNDVRSLAQQQLKSSQKVQVKEEVADTSAEQHEAAQNALWKSVLKLHSRLGTKLEGDSLLRLQKLAIGHGFAPNEPANISLEQRIEYFVLRGLFQRCAERAWDRLETLMVEANELWPIPPDLSYHRAPESVEKFVELRRESQREEFLNAPLPKQAALVTGDVKVWGPSYPEPDSWLWHQTALLCVGAGLQLQLFAAVLELWLWRSGGLDTALRTQLEKELVAVKDVLKRGVVTLEEADNIAEQSRRVCSEIIPGLVWKYVEPRLKWDASLATLSTLSDRLSTVDPVCAMALTSERIACRYVYEEKTYYFCCARCKDQFQKDPRQFLEEQP